MPQPKDKDWLNGYKKLDPHICCLQKTHLNKTEDTYRLKVKGWFGGAEFSQLLLVCKALDFSFIFE